MKENNILKDILTSVIKYMKMLIVLALVVLCLSGITFVEADEVALVLRFGKLVGTTPSEQIKKSGLCLAFPNFIDEVIKIPVGKVNEINIDALYSEGEIIDVTQNGYALTGDNNIVRIKIVVKYKISDPINYALYSKNEKELITGIVSGMLTNNICTMNVDSVLTDMKQTLAANVLADSQAILDKVKAGVNIENIEIGSIQPPVEVISYFDQVTSAYVEKETLIQEAYQYQKGMMPRAQSDYDLAIADAEVYKYEVLTEANQDVAEFLGLLSEYKINPEVIEERVYRDRVINILQNVGEKIILPEGDQTPNIRIN